MFPLHPIFSGIFLGYCIFVMVGWPTEKELCNEKAVECKLVYLDDANCYYQHEYFQTKPLTRCDLLADKTECYLTQKGLTLHCPPTVSLKLFLTRILLPMFTGVLIVNGFRWFRILMRLD